MKTIFAVLFVFGFLFNPARAAEQAVKEPEGAFIIVERGANYRVQERTTMVNDGRRPREIKSSYTELSTGMHYKENGEWKESEEKIEITPEGAAAVKGAHKVSFGPNINNVGNIDLTTSDGKQLRSHVLGISYFDSATGKSALIAEIKDSIGVLHPPNQIVYEDAFTDFKADIRYTYTLAGFEQDLILREQPPSPADFGLNPNTTRLQLLTEFIDPPAPLKEQEMKEGRQVDRVLDFGEMQIGRGKAFMVAGEAQTTTVDVEKAWSKIDGRDFLIEELSYKRIETQLETLPLAPQANAGGVKKVRHLASFQRTLPRRKEAALPTKKEPIRVAIIEPTTKGFVLDYSIVNSQSNFTFKGDSTYYVTNDVYLSGTTTIEGGTVVKGRTNVVSLFLLGPVNCLTDAYRPAIFTAKDDNSVGETISGSTGNPNGYYWWLSLYMASGPLNLHDVRVRNANYAIAIDTGQTTTISHSQFAKCETAIYSFNSALNIRNVLIADSEFALMCEASFPINGEHLTINRCTYLAYDFSESASLTLTNSLLVAVTNIGNLPSVVTNHVQSNSSSASAFKTVGGGQHYLAENSPYRNAGTTNISPGLLSELARRTTYPPIVFSNVTLSAVTTMGPQAQRDTDIPDLGYHYDPLDYVFGGAQANESLTFTAGTAVGWFWPSTGGSGLNMADTKIVDFDGNQTAYNYWVKYNTVQEGANGVWAISYGIGGLTGTADQYLEDVSLSPEVRMRFTRCSMLADAGFCHFRDNYGYLTVRALNCEFLGGNLGAYGTGYYLTNSLFNRAGAGIVEGWPGNEFHLRNCTFYGGSLQITPWYAQIPASIKDCAFDGTTINIDPWGLSTLDFDYNAYLTGANTTDPAGANDVDVPNFDWQTGTLGGYYVPTNSPLINVGSLTNAGLAGLYHFTMTTNQVKETNSIVDIGYHYVAVTNGIPIDTDADGVPDYLEDSNGNGSVNSGETNWQDANDMGLRVLITRPRQGGLLP